MTMRLPKDYLPSDASLEKEPSMMLYDEYITAREWRIAKKTNDRTRLRKYFSNL